MPVWKKDDYWIYDLELFTFTLIQQGDVLTREIFGQTYTNIPFYQIYKKNMFVIGTKTAKKKLFIRNYSYVRVKGRFW